MKLNRKKSQKFKKIITSLTLTTMIAVGSISLNKSILLNKKNKRNLEDILMKETFQNFKVDDFKNAKWIKGLDLQIFKYISFTPSSVSVLKVNINIKDIPFTFYLVYQGEIDYKMLKSLDDTITWASMIDSEILLKVVETPIIIKENKELSSMYLKNNGNGYYNSIYNSIRIFVNSEVVIIHELGHAYDNTLSNNVNHGIWNLEDYNFSDFFPNLISKYYGFEEIILEEAPSILKCLTRLSGYEVKDYLNDPREYFADCFFHYYLYPSEREKLEEIAPKTYQILTSFLEEDIKKYQKKR